MVPIYLLLLTVAMCAAYLLLYFGFTYFFTNKIANLGSGSLVSIVYISLFSLASYGVSVLIADLELANRILHVFGGGFLAFLVCFLVVRDSKVAVTRFQFVVLSFLVVVALGVANEIAEFFLQNYLAYTAALTINDTWLDLISNVVGASLAAFIFTPFVTSTHIKHTEIKKSPAGL